MQYKCLIYDCYKKNVIFALTTKIDNLAVENQSSNWVWCIRGKDSYGIIYFHVNIDFIIPARADGLFQAQKCIAYSGRIKTY